MPYRRSSMESNISDWSTDLDSLTTSPSDHNAASNLALSGGGTSITPEDHRDAALSDYHSSNTGLPRSLSVPGAVPESLVAGRAGGEPGEKEEWERRLSEGEMIKFPSPYEALS